MGLRTAVGTNAAVSAGRRGDITEGLQGKGDHGPLRPAGAGATARCGRAAAQDSSELAGNANGIRLTFAATPDAVRAALAQVTDGLRDVLLPDECGALEIVLAEVLNNVAEHAYAGTSPGQVELSVAVDAASVRCRVCDEGVELPGILVSAPVPDMGPGFDPADLQEGGYGWHLIHALTSALTYERRGNRNTLDLELPRSGNGRGRPAGA